MLLAAAVARADEAMLSLQVTLDRFGFSPGVIDGRSGAQTRAAIQAWQLAHELPPTGELGGIHTPALLPPEMLYTNCVVTADDLAQLGPFPKDWLERSKLPRMACETARELYAERFHCKEAFIQRLNPRLTNWVEGATIRLPNTLAEAAPARKAARLRINLTQKFIRAFDAQDKVIAHFPCSIAAKEEKRPVGALTVVNAALHPDYTFDPVNFPELDAQQKRYGKLHIPPGPNNPVGAAWIGLSKPGYGIHGTPHPEDVGRTESHGCFRLANWNAERLARMIEAGTPVEVISETPQPPKENERTTP
jgi:peptidoglycan hydrolase-like protein with peptidoglycan-binding domain